MPVVDVGGCGGVLMSVLIVVRVGVGFVAGVVVVCGRCSRFCLLLLVVVCCWYCLCFLLLLELLLLYAFAAVVCACC